MRSGTELWILGVLTLSAGFIHWHADGKPSGFPAAALAETPLKPGEIKLETLQTEGMDSVLWVDARREEQWKANGLLGSILLTSLSERSLDEQIAEHLMVLNEATRIVIYCDDLHCGLSHELAERLKAGYAELITGEILVLQGGATALQAAQLID